MRFQKFMAALLVSVIALPAQQSPPAAKPAEPASLKIIVVEGEGAKNNVRSHSAVPPVVEVRDEAERPVVGAEVTFQLPPAGPSGNFNGWLKTQTTKTDDKGRATVSGYAPSDEEGRLNIKVTASVGTKLASVVIAQTNVRGANGSASSSARPGWWKWAAVIGGVAVAGGVVAATRGSDSNSVAAATKPITITTGAISVGGPR